MVHDVSSFFKLLYYFHMDMNHHCYCKYYDDSMMGTIFKSYWFAKKYLVVGLL